MSMYAVNCNVLCHNSSYVVDLNRRLKDGWSAHFSRDGRIYYCNHATQTSSWLPPPDNWDVKSSAGLPYGWEMAIDKDGKQYFINHLNKTTTYEDPGKQVYEEPPKPREVELFRDQEMGFGFVAGSEKPVIVRFVTDGGPSTGKLLPGDLILKVNGEDVKKAPRDHVIELVRACRHSVLLCVCQPETNNSARKSALLSASKKARLRSHPSRVRFAEGVVINGSPLFSPSNFSSESCIPFMPNVLKVFLENGQTKSFKYDSSTLVQDVLESLQQKLGVKCLEHFSLVVEHIKSLRRNKLTLLNPKEYLAKIAARPGAQHLRCLFRVTFVPKEAYELLKKDPVTFEYLYMQCCNDVVQERFAPELKYDIALRLAALHTQQHALSSSSIQIGGKISVKAIERDCGLEHFVPMSLMETMKRKELRKLLGHFLKLNQGLSAPGQKSLTAMQAKLHYLRIISELPSYGARCFSTNLRDSNMETVILVSPKFGISQISGARSSLPLTLANIEDLSGVVINREDELSHQIELQMEDPESENILLSLEDRDSEELVLLLQGYYRLLTNRPLTIVQEKDRWTEDAAPPYHTRHTVQPVGWNYAEMPTTTTTTTPATSLAQSTMGGERVATNHDDVHQERSVDLACSPPPYQPNKGVTTNGHPTTGDINSSMTATELNNHPSVVDRNMNRMAFYQRELIGTPRSFDESATGGNDPSALMSAVTSELRHVITMEVKNRPTTTGSSTHHHLTSGFRNGGSFLTDVGHHSDDGVTSITVLSPPPPPETDFKSDEAIRRVAEMQQIVLNAEMYLTEEEGTDTDRDSSRNESAQGDLEGIPKLKAADSLLLLTQVGLDADIDEAVKCIRLSGFENDQPSESDTDSMSTPTDSPSHHPTKARFNRTTMVTNPSSSSTVMGSTVHQPVLRSGSSFGLHSPGCNNIPITAVDKTNLDRTNLQELLQKLQENRLPYQFAEGTLYLDPDIIDLTMIPPPITPDQEEAPTSVSFPPTPFADRMSLEAELSHGLLCLNPLTMKFLKGPHALDPMISGCPTNNGFRPMMNATSLKQIGILSQSTSSASDQLDEAVAVEDIDKFIASVTVPPPPASLGQFTFNEHSPIQELTQEEISAYIIPPPPASSSSDTESEMISRFQSAASTLKRLVEPSIDGMDHDDQRERSLTELDERPEVTFTIGEVNCVTAMTTAAITPSVLSQQPSNWDSSGYETAVSNVETKTTSESMSSIISRRKLNNSFSDNSSTISCSSAEMAGTQADTEDNTTLDDEMECSPSPLLGVNRTSRHQHVKAGHVNGVVQQISSIGNLPNGIVRLTTVPTGGSNHRSRYPSSSSDDGGNNITSCVSENTISTAIVTAGSSSSPRRHASNIPRHHGSANTTLTRKGSKTMTTTATVTAQNKNERSSSNDRLSRANSLDGVDVDADSRCELSASIENLAAAATAVTDRRSSTSVDLNRSPSSALKSVKRISGATKQNSCETSGNRSVDNNNIASMTITSTGTNIKSPSSIRSRSSSNGAWTVFVSDTPTPLQADRLGSKTINQYRTLVQRTTNDNGEGSSFSKGVNRLHQSPSSIPSLTAIKHDTKCDSLSKRSGKSNAIKVNQSSNSKLPRPSITDKDQTSRRITSVNNNVKNNASDFTDSRVGSICDVTFRKVNTVECHRDRRDSFYGAEEAIGNMLIRLDDALNLTSYSSMDNTSISTNETSTAKNSLLMACDCFVKSSKMLIKSATESEERLVESLASCLGILDVMFDSIERLAKCELMSCSTSSSTTRSLVMSVKDVAFTFLQTVQAASELAVRIESRSMETRDGVWDRADPGCLKRVMQQATALVAALTPLVNTLKVII